MAKGAFTLGKYGRAPTPSCDGFYNMFRIFMTGPNSNRHYVCPKDWQNDLLLAGRLRILIRNPISTEY